MSFNQHSDQPASRQAPITAAGQSVANARPPPGQTSRPPPKMPAMPTQATGSQIGGTPASRKQQKKAQTGTSTNSHSQHPPQADHQDQLVEFLSTIGLGTGERESESPGPAASNTTPLRFGLTNANATEHLLHMVTTSVSQLSLGETGISARLLSNASEFVNLVGALQEGSEEDEDEEE